MNKKCMCRKSRKSNQQCPNKRIDKAEYCGKHIKCYKKTGRIDDENILNISEINFDNYMKVNFSKLHVKDLRTLLERYHIKTKKKLKKDMCKEIKYFMSACSKVQKFDDSITKITKIQALFRGKRIRDMYGKLVLSKCINSMDIDGTIFWKNIENKNIINKEVFYEKIFIFNENNFNYCFFVKSFKKNLNFYGKNPYTTENFSPNTIKNFEKRMRYIKFKKKNIELSNCLGNFISEEKKFELIVFKVFQIIESLGNYANHNWFILLSHADLKKFYYNVRSIWEHTISNNQEKRKILPHRNAFHLSNYVISIIPSREKRKLQILIINHIDKFITTGINIEYRRFAAWIILTALTKVSQDAANSLPYNII